MQDFDYLAPRTIDEAVRALAAAPAGGARILAGGTDILVQLREHQRSASLVVDVKKIPELMELRFSRSAGLVLGGSVPCHLLYESAEISAAYGALTDAARIIGGWQIQSRASIGGNLCNSSPAADSIPGLIVHAAQCCLAGPQGKRSVPVAEFCTGPGKNVLQPGELLVAIGFPPPQSREASSYLRFIPRNEMDIAVAGAAAWVKLDATGRTIEKARIALSAVAPTPKLAAQAGDSLAGRPATEDEFQKAGELAKKVASPIDDVRGTAEYRLHLVGVLVKRTLAQAAARAAKS